MIHPHLLLNYICNVKFMEKHIDRLLLSIVFLLAIGHHAIAFESWDVDSANQRVSLLEESESDQPIEINKFSLVKASQIISTQEYSGVGWLSAYCSEDSIAYARLSSHHTTVNYLEDQRRLLSRYLYPFHFFW